MRILVLFLVLAADLLFSQELESWAEVVLILAPFICIEAVYKLRWLGVRQAVISQKMADERPVLRNCRVFLLYISIVVFLVRAGAGEFDLGITVGAEGFNGDDTDDLLRPVKQWQARQELRDLSKVIIRGLLARSEGEARFVLLPGMQKLVPQPRSSRLFEAHTHEKDPPEADRSSRLFMALPRYVGEQMTSNRINAPREIRSGWRSPPRRRWKLNSVITLWELPPNDCMQHATHLDSPEALIPAILQN